MKVIIDRKNPITVLDEDGNVLFQHNPDKITLNLEELDIDNLDELGLAEGEINQIKQILEKRKREFY